MLVEDLSSILKAVNLDYGRFGILSLLQNIATILVDRASGNGIATYNNSRSSFIKEAEAIIDDEDETLKSQQARDIFASSQFRGLLPSDIARTIINILPVEANLAGSSSEALQIRNRVSLAAQQFATFYGVADAFKVGSLVLPADDVAIALSVPKHVIEGDLRRFAEVVIRYDEFARYAIEYLTGRPDALRLASLSTSDFHIVSLLTPENAVNFFKAVRILIDVATSALKFRRAATEIAAFGAPVNFEVEEERYRNLLRQRISDSFRELRTQETDVGRANEIESRLIASGSYIAGMMQHGLEIHIDVKTTATVKFKKGTIQQLGEDKTNELIAQLLGQQLSLRQIVNGDELPLLLKHQPKTDAPGTTQS